MLVKRPVLYSQSDKKWGKIPYGTDTIATAGCGITCMAMALTGLTGKMILPSDMRILSEGHHDKVAAGTSWAFFQHAVEHYKPLKCTQVTDIMSVLKALKTPNTLVIASMKPGHFTRGGHYILLCGADAKNNIMVNDSAGLLGAARSKKLWPISIIKAEAKQYWIISK